MSGAKVYRRVRWRLSFAIALANLVGGLTVFGLLAFFLPFNIDKPFLIVRSAVLGAAYLGIALWIGIYFGRRRGRRLLEWVAEERPPTDGERRYALAQPREDAFITACFW